MRYYTLWCEKEWAYRQHKITEDGRKETIECLACGRIREDYIVAKRVRLRKDLWSFIRYGERRRNRNTK